MAFFLFAKVDETAEPTQIKKYIKMSKSTAKTFQKAKFRQSNDILSNN